MSAGIVAADGSDRRVQRFVWAAVVLLGVVAMWRAATLAWLCDDSFISIRYAENLANGLGLVYNADEYVEGYTNFSWTLMLAAFAAADVSPVTAARYLGILFYAALAFVLVRDSVQFAQRSGTPFLPLAAGLTLVSNDFHIWATGGLETMLFTYLAIHALLCTRSSTPNPKRALFAGVLFSALVLTRLDGLLFAAAGCASFWVPTNRFSQRERMEHALLVAVPVGTVLAVVIPVKFAYYGDILPTAFYSKSVLQPYLEQGLIYVGLYLAKNWYLPVALAGLLIAYRRSARGASDPATADACFFGATAVLFACYIVEVGGDFMFARRLIPIAPLLFLVVERLLVRHARPGRRLAVAGAVLAGAALPISLYGESEQGISGVYDERRSYPDEKLAMRELQGATVAAALAGTEVRAAYEGGMCVFGYYSGLPYLAEATGLTQYSLAKRPLVERGPIGHEKSPDPEWFSENRIHLLFKRDLPPLQRPVDPDAIDEVRFGDVAFARVLHYSDAVMDPLRGRPGITFVPIEAAIERAAVRMQAASLPAAQAMYDQLSRYYFDAAGERGRAAASRLSSIIEAKRKGAAAPPGS
jgi:hypothetical protein